MQQQKFLSVPRVDFSLLLLIIIAGTILRFIFFGSCPYTHDEISSLVRTGYSSFSELIEQGVKPDTHPPLLQIFLHYYTKIFGISEMAVKFPFVVFGILSIYLVYLVASKWFGKTAGLLSAAVVSTVQYTVMYSLIARHYSLGLFLTLFLVYCQAKFFEADGKKRFRWLFAFTITGIACSYLHYFCLLFTAIVAITGFLFVTRRNLWHYLAACLLIPAAFVPYLPVFFVQFGYKGIGGPDGWLGAPDSSFFLTYFRYMFHYSNLFLLLIAAIFLFGLASQVIKRKNIISKYRLISLAWFLIPMLTAYFYSVKVNPILQYSILIFSFPYLLMFLFSFLNDIKPVVKTSMVVLILCIGTVTLVYGRKHYELFYNQGIHKIISEIDNARQQFGTDSVESAIEIEDYFIDFYNKNFPAGKNAAYIALSGPGNLPGFIRTVSLSKKNYFVFGTVRVYPVECRQILKEYFPYVVREYKGHLTEVIVCSKTPVKSQIDETIFSAENKLFSEPVSPDSAGAMPVKSLSDEFVGELKTPLNKLVHDRNDFIHTCIAGASCTQDSATSPMLVMSMESGDKTVDWRAVKFSDYFIPDISCNVYLSLRLSDININPANTVLKTYIWNKDKQLFTALSLKVRSEKGNPYFYGLFEEF